MQTYINKVAIEEAGISTGIFKHEKQTERFWDSNLKNEKRSEDKRYIRKEADCQEDQPLLTLQKNRRRRRKPGFRHELSSAPTDICFQPHRRLIFR